MKTKRILAILLSVMMIFSIIPTMAFAEEETSGFDNFKKVLTLEEDKLEDVKNTDWFFDNLKSVYESGLMVGRSETEFAPEENMTVAEAMTIAARLNSIYKTGKAEFSISEPWYKVYTDYCKGNGIADIAKYEPNALITRGQFADIFANALPEEALAQINEIANGAIPDVKEGDAFSEAVYSLYRAGILVGNDDKGTFASNTNIKRNEVTAITGRMAVPAQRQKITLKVEGAEYTVSFDLGYDNKALDSIKVKDGEKATAPSAPLRSGYTFAGWYTLKTGGTKFDFNKSITADTALYAHWNKRSSGGGSGSSSRSYTVAFVSDKGEALEPITVKSGEKTAEPTVSEVAGFYVEGWYKEAEFQNKWDFDTDKVTKDITLYANWIVEDRTFKAVAVEYEEGKYTLNFYFDNKDHSAEGTVYEGDSLFDNSKSYGEKWGYNSLRRSIYDVKFDKSVKAYHNLTSTEYMLYDITNAESLTGEEYLDVSNVTSMNSMFNFFGIINLTKAPDVADWDTGKVTNMASMFANYGKTVVSKVPDISKWDTSNVTNMNYMFMRYGMSSTALNFTLDLSGWDTLKVASATDMFSEAGNKAGDDNWNVKIPEGEMNASGNWQIGEGVEIIVPEGRTFEEKVVTKTLAEILAKNEDFPKSENDTVPDNAWVHEEGKCKAFVGKYDNADVLDFKDVNGVHVPIPLTETSTKIGDNFVYEYPEAFTITFITKEGKLVSVKFEVIDDYFKHYAGTYAPPVKGSLSLLSTSDVFSEELIKQYGLTDYNSFGYLLYGKDFKSARYYHNTSAIISTWTDSLEELVAEYGADFTSDIINTINTQGYYANGFKVLYPNTEYQMIVIAENISGAKKTFVANYTTAPAPETKTLVEILPDDFPTLEGNAWKSANGAKCGTFNDAGIAFSGNNFQTLVLFTKELTKDGNDWKSVTLEGNPVTFVMTEGKLTSIEISGYTEDKAGVNGTYAPATIDKDSYTIKKGTELISAFSSTINDKTKITDIIFGSKLPQGVNEQDGVDITANGTGKVKGYIVANGDNFKIYIVGDYIFGNEDCSGMFNDFSNLTTLDLGNFDTSNVTTMTAMFRNCSKLTSLDLSKLDTSKVTQMNIMFNGCQSLTSLDLGKFDTSNVTTMAGMFNGCLSLESLDLAKFDTEKVTNANNMFCNCVKLSSVKIEAENDMIKGELGDVWTYGSGAYTATAPAAPLTIKIILNTYSEGLPISADEKTAPVGAWTTTDGKSCYRYGSNHIIFNNKTDAVLDCSDSDIIRKSGNDYVYIKNNNVTITFNMTDDVLTGITVTGPEVEGANYYGTYEPAAETKTLAEILETNQDFPTSQSDAAPTNAWVNNETNGFVAFKGINVSKGSAELYVGDKENVSNRFMIDMTDEFEKNGNNYTFVFAGTTFTCVMNNGKITSLIVTTEESYYGEYAGTYEPAVDENSCVVTIVSNPEGAATFNQTQVTVPKGSFLHTYNPVDTTISIWSSGFEQLLYEIVATPNEGNTFYQWSTTYQVLDTDTYTLTAYIYEQ